MLSRCLLAFLAAAVTLATGCNHCRCTSYRRPLFRHRSTCCEPAACCGYSAPVMHGPVAPVPVMHGPVPPVAVMQGPVPPMTPPMHHP